MASAGTAKRLQLTPPCAQGTLLKPSTKTSHNKQPPQIVPAQITPLSAWVSYSSLAGRPHKTISLPRSVRCNSPPSLPWVIYSSLAWTSHKKINLPRSVRRKLPPSVSRVTYSSLAGTSHKTIDLPRSVWHKCSCAVCCVMTPK